MATILPSRLMETGTAFCHAFPMRTGILSAGMKGALADLSSQAMLQQGEPFQPSRTAAFFLWNAAYCGGFVYWAYSVRAPRMLPVRLSCGLRHPQAARNTALLCGIDNFVATPLLCMPLYYLFKSAIDATADERQRPIALSQGALRQYANESREVLALSWGLWVPIHLVTFSVVPEPLRTHFTAACSFCTLTLMSLLQSRLEARRPEPPCGMP